MHRFFVSPNDVNIEQGEIVIRDEDVKHISKVLRLKENDEIEVCDGEAKEYICKIEEVEKNQVILSILSSRISDKEAPVRVILYQGIPKSTKMDLIIQKTTELGVTDIIPVETERTIVQFDNDKDRIKKVERWQKISLEAAKQSKRGVVPRIHMPIGFKEAMKQAQKNSMNIMPYENAENIGIRKLIGDLSQEEKASMEAIGIWIGPEGGFEAEEVEMAYDRGVHPITLGPRILRTETAGFTALSLVMYELGDIGGA